MAKDKTKPRPELEAKREAALKAKKQATNKRRLKVLRNVLIAVVIIGLAATGIVFTVRHVQAGQKVLEYTGDPNVTQITPPNAASDGLSILANPNATLQDGYVTVDVHVDYQNGNAVQAMQYYGQALMDLANAGNIKLSFHLHIAMDTQYSNQASGRAAVAAACADTVGEFMAYNQAIFAAATLSPSVGQVGFTDDQLQNTFPAAAGITGSDLSAFQTCYTNRATSSFITAMDSGNQTTPVPGNTDYPKGVTATPLILANNQTVDIADDMSQATGSTDDAQTLLQMLQYYAGQASS